MRVGVLEAGHTLGRELAEELQRRWPDDAVRLLTLDSERVGVLEEVGSAAALLVLASADELASLDALLIPSPPPDLDCEQILGAGSTILVEHPEREWTGDGFPIVCGVNAERADRSILLLSPSPSIVALSLVLAPLLDLEPRTVSGTVLEPASSRGTEGVDELLEQARTLLAFQTDIRTETLGARLAFSAVPRFDASAHLPGRRSGEDRLEAQLTDVLGTSGLALRLTTVRAGHFHGHALSVECSLGSSTTPAVVRDRLAQAPLLEVRAKPPAVDEIAGSDTVLVSILEEDLETPRSSIRLWILIDHLTRGSALNAADIVEALVASGPDATTH